MKQERRPTRISDRQNATMMLVGDVKDRTAILIDDLADTSNTIVRAANLLKREGATTIYALLTHGILSGDAIERINASALDKVVVTNTVPQEEHLSQCPKLEVLEVGSIFAEASRLSSFHGRWLTGASRRSEESIMGKASVLYSSNTTDDHPQPSSCDKSRNPTFCSCSCIWFSLAQEFLVRSSIIRKHVPLDQVLGEEGTEIDLQGGWFFFRFFGLAWV